MLFNLDTLNIVSGNEINRISAFLRDELFKHYRRSGVIIGLSGGVDSSVMASLAVEALGKEKVFGFILPEKESNPVSSQYASKHAERLGIDFIEKDITTTVDAICGYRARDEYLRSLVPSYTPDCKYNIVLPTDFLERIHWDCISFRYCLQTVPY